MDKSIINVDITQNVKIELWTNDRNLGHMTVHVLKDKAQGSDKASCRDWICVKWKLNFG